ncbi:hypothetical protein BCV69DRAFT_191542 [Microstroma glucosiphilum]|uniref:Transmembrane protein n=1 Tax=Pseudomicrostroma glucosiphilum TaxID=1684307 RepID=A0A316UBW9_9BASI|nr:hypothetical protein BCV69DRAFT_191542 [Pseudomicrostroma glucosiphilum]PWN20525.1 hypothetical protein BCV69DRAFT_191542 [Pseudomicrostroma glucosiphilum]
MRRTTRALSETQRDVTRTCSQQLCFCKTSVLLKTQAVSADCRLQIAAFCIISHSCCTTSFVSTLIENHPRKQAFLLPLASYLCSYPRRQRQAPCSSRPPSTRKDLLGLPNQSAMRYSPLFGLVVFTCCLCSFAVSGICSLPLEKRQDNGLRDYFRPPSMRVAPGYPPLPQKPKLKKTLSFSDWLQSTPKKARSHASKHWTNRAQSRWEKEILKNVKALH